MLIMVTSTPNYNNRIKITNKNLNSDFFTNLLNHSYSFYVYFFIYSLIMENSVIFIPSSNY